MSYLWSLFPCLCLVESLEAGKGKTSSPWQYPSRHPPCGFHLNSTPDPFSCPWAWVLLSSLPSTLLGTRWPVNSASPLRPSDRPRALTSQDKGTQNGKLLLIASHASGVHFMKCPKPAGEPRSAKVSCCILSYYPWIVSLTAHSASWTLERNSW